MLTNTFLFIAPIFASLMSLLHWVIVVGLGLRIILKRRPTGVSLAWLGVVTVVPFVGAFMYLLVGEIWLPKRRIRRYAAFKHALTEQILEIDKVWDVQGQALPRVARPLNALARNPLRISAIGGNALELFHSSTTCFQAVIADIDRAQLSVSMLFYIWESGGEVELVEEALIRAAQRGVVCRVLVDDAGSKKFVRSDRARELKQAGIEIAEALPAGLFRILFERIDIRNHRKIITIDHDIAYTGSMNMVDPSVFNVTKGVGRWVDVMARVRGPAARVLDMAFCLDWAIESSCDPVCEMETLSSHEPVESMGEMPLQVVPSGPDQAPRVIHDMLLALVYNTSRRLIITTPYFIPSESMLTAITGASLRGVAVTLVVPEKVDSILVRHGSKSYFEDLLDAGVEIRAYQGGLLHAKTVTADDDVAMLGTVNMDKRSFWINFEISLFAYEKKVVDDLRMLQGRYIEESVRIEPKVWASRSMGSRLIQNTVQLLAPIL